MSCRTRTGMEKGWLFSLVVLLLLIIMTQKTLGSADEAIRRRDLFARASTMINNLLNCINQDDGKTYYDNKPGRRNPQKDCLKDVMTNFGSLVQEAHKTEEENIRFLREIQIINKENGKVAAEISRLNGELKATRRQLKILENEVKEKNILIERYANEGSTGNSAAVGEVHKYASKIRPPAYPLAVRSPYLNVWLTDQSLPGSWPKYWNGHVKGWQGMARVDGEAFLFMGDGGKETGKIRVGHQQESYITPTQTIFIITTGQIELKVTFLSPVEFDDVKRQSIPLSYVFVTAKSRDGRSHDVQIYMDIAGEWASTDLGEIVKWDLTTGSSLKIWTFQLENPVEFAEHSDYPRWGQAVLATGSNSSHQSGGHLTLREGFAVRGNLQNLNDRNFRCVNCDWPVLAFAHDLGRVAGESRELQFVVGHVRENIVNVMGQPEKALWTQYFQDKHDMIQFFLEDVEHAKRTAAQLDNKLLTEAYALGGQDYADIIALSLRQSMAGTEFAGNRTHPLLFHKMGRVQTVDGIYPASPMYYYMNPKYLQYLLDPLFHQMEEENGYGSSSWPNDFALHDIGLQYPNITDYPEGDGGLLMPVEETANMILMTADIVIHPRYGSCEARNYVTKHYPILSKWAKYLHTNSLHPEEQLMSDNFIGVTANNTGLALKGILALKAFGRMAELVGDSNATRFYDSAVEQFMSVWEGQAVHSSGSHLKFEYGDSDKNGYQLKYDAFQDKLLGLNVIPNRIYDMEATWYSGKEEEYGIPLVYNQDYTKSDWELWTAAAFGDVSPTLKSNVIKKVAKFLRDAPAHSRAPFGDWYVTATGKNLQFSGRPVVGGHFALLARSV